MRRKGVGRNMPEWEKEHLGGHMDDYFGYDEQDSAAEDAYEHAWIARAEFSKEEFDQLMLERDRWKADYERLSNESLGPYYD